MNHWFRSYWQWWVGFGWLIGYEIYALITRQATLSRLVWRAYRDNIYLPWIVMPICLTLLVHFFVRKETPFPIALGVMGVVLVVMWWVRR